MTRPVAMSRSSDTSSAPEAGPKRQHRCHTCGSRIYLRVLLVATLCTLTACYRAFRRASVDQVRADNPETVRLHLRDGQLVVLSRPSVVGDRVDGQGVRYRADRYVLSDGQQTVPLAEIAVVEIAEQHVSAGSLTVVLAGGGAMTAMIILIASICSRPKGCFGSCPTFYVRDGANWRLQAEGFSTSISRSLEDDDVDALPDARLDAGALTIAMRNEAYETHFVRSVRVLAVEGPAGSTVRMTPARRFVAIGDTATFTACNADSPACAAMRSPDGNDWGPTSNGVDLAARSQIEFTFSPVHRTDAAVNLSMRNSLMTTYLLYRLMALHGRQIFALHDAIDRLDAYTISGLAEFRRALGDVDVFVRQGNAEFRRVGSIGYIGPIARGVYSIPFQVDEPSQPIDVRLDFAAANWRFDSITVASVVANDLQPSATVAPTVVAANRHDAARAQAQLAGAGDSIVTVPGDELQMRFAMPASSGSVGYFLQSRGYYREWMRSSWLREENLSLAREYLRRPREALRRMAPEYRAVEPELEALFRSSRFVRAERR